MLAAPTVMTTELGDSLPVPGPPLVAAAGRPAQSKPPAKENAHNEDNEGMALNMVPSGDDPRPSFEQGSKVRQSTNSSFDLVILGGGINGAALARLAAFQGLKVALFEAGDFGHGASSNTSKLLHGGLRYLETYDFGLVREAVRERSRWLRLAPHLAEERRFHFPIVPQGRHGRLLIKCGMMLYDGLAGAEHLGGHRWLGPQAFAASEPGFLPTSRQGAYAYADCVMDDARHCLETMLDAESLGASVHNYHEVTAVQENDAAVEFSVLNRLTGREQVVQAERGVILAGPWTDQLLRRAAGKSTQWVRRSQGIHLIVDGLSARECLILPVPKSPRYFFVIPDGTGWHWVGTTEYEIPGDIPESPAPTEQEIEELLALLRLYFPRDKPRLLGTFAGVRPLAKANKSLTAKLSREHAIHPIGQRLYSVVGGKYTTHRPLAQDLFRHMLGKKAIKRSLDSRPLPGAWANANEKARLISDLQKHGFATPDLVAAWCRRYGIRARAVAAAVSASPEAQKPLPGSATVLRGELDFAIAQEHARTPVDFFRRRTRLFFTPGGGLPALELARETFAAAFPGAEKLLGETADYSAYLRRYRHLAVTSGERME